MNGQPDYQRNESVGQCIELTELCFHKPKVFIFFFDIELIILIPAVTLE